MGLKLDYTTLFASTTLTALTVTLAMFYVWRVHRRTLAVRYWMLGFLSWSLGTLCVALAPTGGILLPKVMSNVFGIAAGTFMYAGTAQFLGRVPRWRLLAAVYAPVLLAILYWAYATDYFVGRIYAYAVGVIATCLLMAHDLWTSGHGPQRATYRFVGSLWLAFALLTALRALAPLLDPSATDRAYASPVMVAWIIGCNLANLLACIGYLLMVSQRLQEKNNWARIEELFHETLRLPASQRAAHLSSVCDGDAVLRAELESLIEAADHPGGDALDRGIGLDTPVTRAAPQGLSAGARVGPYRIERLLGHGGMGEVYLAANDDAAQAPVALKLLRAEAQTHSQRFADEQRIVATLQHPGIARLCGSGEVHGRPYMALEYVPGVAVTEYCRRRQSPLRERLRLFAQACAAVAYAHERHVVHRDLKPGNMLVREDGTLKLLDFGIAKRLTPLSWLRGDDTVTLAVPFTPEYAAPEQLEGGSVTAATDVYALGVVLFELLTGELPWPLKSLPPSVALHKVLHETPRRASEAASVSAARPVLPRLLRGDLDAILARCLAKRARDRYPSVAALLADLERTQRGQALVHRRVAAAVWVALQAPWRRNPAAATAVAVLLGVLVAAAAHWVLAH